MPFDTLTTRLEAVGPFLGRIDEMLHTARSEKTEYVQPALKSLGAVTLVILREVVSPASFRNAEAEITDIDHDGVRRVRAVANKFKFGERARGLQVLRHLGAGGTSPQNRTAFSAGERPSARFDLNTFVFGDSSTHGKHVLPVKAAALYSDAISLQPYGEAVDSTFHNRASEDGSLWDAAAGANSNNLFERHFVRPGTLLLQTICFNGRTAPVQALEHLLLCIGLAGAYGGGTSIYGVNVRNHLVGLYAGRLERDLASPYVLAARLQAAGLNTLDPATCASALDGLWEGSVKIGGEELHATQADLIGRIEASDEGLKTAYRETAGKIGAYFDAWFKGVGG